MKAENNSGYIYLFECLNFRYQYKIGYSKSPEKRAGGFIARGIKIKILKTIESRRAREIESELQNKFYRYSHWNIFQKICNIKPFRNDSDISSILRKYSTPDYMSCEWFYLKPKRLIDVLESFEQCRVSCEGAL